MATRLFLIAEVRVYRQVLAWRLSQEGLGTLVGTATTARAALQAIANLRPEIVLVDVAPPGSLGDVRLLAGVAPGARIVALAVTETPQDLAACAAAGIVGCVLRDATFSELVATLRRVQSGEARCPRRIAAGRGRVAARDGPATLLPRLTPREEEILALIDQGLSNSEIARRLVIELATVKNHVHHILEKLHVHQRGAAAAVAAGRVPHSFTSPAK